MNPTISATSPYSEFLAELDQIQKHKWLAREKEGKDVGFDRALTDAEVKQLMALKNGVRDLRP